MNTLALGIELMGYGLLGVFSTLIAFILMILALTKLFPHKDEDQ